MDLRDIRQLKGFPAADVGRSFNGTARDPRDDQMDQVRDLLFGDLKRHLDQRFAIVEQRLATLEQRVQALSGEHVTARRETLDDLSRGINELGDYIRRIARP